MSHDPRRDRIAKGMLIQGGSYPGRMVIKADDDPCGFLARQSEELNELQERLADVQRRIAELRGHQT